MKYLLLIQHGLPRFCLTDSLQSSIIAC